MSAWELPTSLNISGVEYDIRSDFRAILDILTYFSDPTYETDEQWEICLDILYVDYEHMPYEHKQEAAQKASEFISCGMKESKRPQPRLMDWEQDAPIIIPAVNRVLGYECRAVEYMHWWTFIGAYMEIGESLFSNVVGIRSKKKKGKKLEKYEKDFYNENKEIIDLKIKHTAEEEATINRLNALLD